MVEFAGQANIKNQSAVEMYGFGTIFRKLCLLPEWFPIKVDAQHGVSLWMIPPSHNLNAPERLVFVHSNRWVDIFRKHGRKGAVAVGSPFVSYRHYLLRRHGSAGTPPRGAIFYLSHSTFWEKASWESADLVRLLENIRSQEGSLTVCVHFVDVLNGLAKPIYDAGFDLATAGNYFNSEFPDNFYALLHGHRTIYTNAVGSHVFYAVEASKEVKWVDLPHHYVNIGYEEQVWNDCLQQRPIEDAVKRHLQNGVDDKAALEDICHSELGLNATPSRLRLLGLILLSNLDWYLLRKLRRLYWRLTRHIIQQ